MRSKSLASLALSLALALVVIAPETLAQSESFTPHQPASGDHGAVATRTRFASEAGIEILKKGGNAVDAAVAIGFALAVTYPQAGNLGGGGFLLTFEPKRGVQFLDYREIAPRRLTREL